MNENDMTIEEAIERLKFDIIRSVQEIVRIKSVEGSPAEGKPFGVDVDNALQFALKLASDMGFKTKNIDGYAGYAEYGNGDEMVGVAGHLDVVPEGEGWSYPPYEGEIHNNKIYGRGTVDDKGPLIAALYGMKAVKDLGIPINKRVRIIFGTDEESGWLDMDYYRKHDVMPDIGFTPDGTFPVINAEKGAMNVQFKKNIIRKSNGYISIKSIKGGEAVNVVPSLCVCELKLKDMGKVMFKDTLELYAKKNNVNLSIVEHGDMCTVYSKGIPSHSSVPQHGKNAISQLVVFLSQFDLGQNDTADFIRFLAQHIGNETNGKSFNIECSDDISGELTLSLGLIDINENSASATINIRYPVKCSYENIADNISKAANQKKVQMSIIRHIKPLYIDDSAPLIKKLLCSYRTVTGDMGEPISIGGQTYAKAFSNMVAFGPVFPGEKENAHMANEYIDIDNLIKCAKIYGRAIFELLK